MKERVERHLTARGWTIVRDEPDAATRLATPRIVRVVWGSGYPPARTPLDLLLSYEIATLMTAAGHRAPTVKSSLIVRNEGTRQVSREINL
jgi:hypothetical protein